MKVLQLAGFGSFMLASLILGIRLLRLAGRTRQWPELSIGLAFLFAGFIGWSGLSALQILKERGASPASLLPVALFALGFVAAGTIANCVGAILIFRPSERWPIGVTAVLAAVMVGGWITVLTAPSGSESHGRWVVLGASSLSYAWSAVEYFLVYDTLRRRARIGLADPVVATRSLLWAIGAAQAVVLVLSALVTRYVFGLQDMPPPVSALQSVLGLISAGAVWCGFFPPRGFARWLAASPLES